MIFLNKETKKAKALLQQYNNATKKTLEEAYKKPSYRKQIAYKNCIEGMRANNGYDGFITAYNTYSFTFAFTTQLNDKTYIHYITSYNWYCIEL